MACSRRGRHSAYSVLTHEANIDVLWDGSIKPVLRARFPAATPDELEEARAYAYGGCVIQDLGYYPFGSHFFSNLLHYVRSGDFVLALIRDAQDVNEYAFALGALGHYAADNDGHRLAVNRAVPLMYPKIEAKFGDNVTYAESPKQHLMVEFAFDVVQVAAGAYASEAYHQYIGFKVAKPALERAYREIYGLDLKDLFVNEDLAIGTYRHAVATTIPQMTQVAWKKKREQIEQVTPGIEKTRFVFNLSRATTKRNSAPTTRQPHGFARFIGFVYALVPKIGPFRTLSFTVPDAGGGAPVPRKLSSAPRSAFADTLEALRAGRLTSRTSISIPAGRRRAASTRSPTKPTTNCSTSWTIASTRTSRSRFAPTSLPFTEPATSASRRWRRNNDGVVGAASACRFRTTIPRTPGVHRRA